MQVVNCCWQVSTGAGVVGPPAADVAHDVRVVAHSVTSAAVDASVIARAASRHWTAVFTQEVVRSDRM
jgi:hypothetical protein